MEAEGQIVLTKEEAQVLMNFINVGLKAIGLEAAESAVHLSKKINEAFKEK